MLLTKDSIQLHSFESTSGINAAQANTTVSLNSTTYTEGSNAINIIKDATSYNNAGIYTAIPTLDIFEGVVSFDLYIKDQTTMDKIQDEVRKQASNNPDGAVNFYLGNGSNRYRTYLIPKSALAVGWNTITKNAMHFDRLEGLNPQGKIPCQNVAEFRLRIFTDVYTDAFAEGDIIVDNLTFEPATDTKGTRFLSRRYPVTEGLTAGTTKQTGTGVLEIEEGSVAQGEVHGS